MTDDEIYRIRSVIRPIFTFSRRESEQDLFNRLEKEKTGGPWHEQRLQNQCSAKIKTSK